MVSRRVYVYMVILNYGARQRAAEGKYPCS